MTETLLSSGDPAPWICRNPDGRSPFFFVSEHAGNLVPTKLGGLGLAEADLSDHIGWDLYIREVGEKLAARMDASYFYQPYSRLVIDCNRPPGNEQSILKIADNRSVPGNMDLSDEHRRQRRDEVFCPFHHTISRALDTRLKHNQKTIFISLHSFTPAMKSGGDARPWQITLQYGRRPELSKKIMAILAADPTLTVGDNVPYPVYDDTNYAIPVHGEMRSLPHTMIELRQDGIASEAGRAYWVNKLNDVLSEVEKKV